MQSGVGRPVTAAGVGGRSLAFIRGGPHGSRRMRGHRDGVRWVAGEGGGREAAARRGEVSRGRTTSGDRNRWEGPNTKPSARTFVLVAVALTAANPFGGLPGEV